MLFKDRTKTMIFCLEIFFAIIKYSVGGEIHDGEAGLKPKVIMYEMDS